MPSKNQLIYTGADYKIFISISNGPTYECQTPDSLSRNLSQEGELVYFMGSPEPGGNKTNNRKYDFTLSVQEGELNAWLALAGLPNALFLLNVTVAVTAIVGAFQQTFKNCNILSAKTEANAKSKSVQTVMEFLALSMV